MTFLFALSASCQDDVKVINDINMEILWYHEDGHIIISLETPTTGWQAIGFNKSPDLTDTYFIFCRIQNNKAESVEYYTESPGKYGPIYPDKSVQRIEILEAHENDAGTYTKIKIPVEAVHRKQKQLSKGMKYTVHYAYSMEDDFQHHSLRRSSTNINL